MHLQHPECNAACSAEGRTQVNTPASGAVGGRDAATRTRIPIAVAGLRHPASHMLPHHARLPVLPLPPPPRAACASRARWRCASWWHGGSRGLHLRRHEARVAALRDREQLGVRALLQDGAPAWALTAGRAAHTSDARALTHARHCEAAHHRAMARPEPHSSSAQRTCTPQRWCRRSGSSTACARARARVCVCVCVCVCGQQGGRRPAGHVPVAPHHARLRVPPSQAGFVQALLTCARRRPWSCPPPCGPAHPV
jgi:hypothetical protein